MIKELKEIMPIQKHYRVCLNSRQPKADMNLGNKKTIYKRKWFKVA